MATSKKPSLKVSSSAASINKNKSTDDQPNSPNLESFACLWLDRDVDSTDDNRKTQQELRQVINHLRTYNNSNQCEQYIQQITHEKVVLIVSGSLGREVIPKLHQLPQFSASYVFCSDKKANEQWAKKYHKVKGVFVERSELVNVIAQDQAKRAKVEDGASISVIRHGSKSLQAHNAIFMWFQLFIEVLLRMHHKSTDREELIDICKKNYKGNQQEMIIIDEFEKTYKSDNAIWWYTREACYYRMMNKALRVQDYDVLFALRFFITDIAKQLKNEHEKFIRTSDTRNVIKVYRGQAIGIDELELMRNSVGEYLSMNSFLSTSRNRLTAIQFARMVSKVDGNVPVLFEIELDPRLKTKAFGDISEMSYYQNEDEILIMLGALFRIENMVEDKKNQMWLARVTLATEDDFHLKETFAYMKEKIGDETNLDSLGKILIEMGEHRQARKCYERMFEETQLAFGDVQLGLGRADMINKDYKDSLEHFEQALNIRKQVLEEYHPKIGESYHFVGYLHWRTNDYKQALKHLNEAMKIQENVTPIDPFALAKTYHYLASTYNNTGEDDLALEFYNKTLKIQQASLPPDHPSIALTYNNLGRFYAMDGNSIAALEYFQKSLDISRKTLPPTHEDIIRTEKNILIIKESLKI